MNEQTDSEKGEGLEGVTTPEVTASLSDLAREWADKWERQSPFGSEPAVVLLRELADEAEKLRALVIEAYDHSGWPSNYWRERAEDLGAWPGAFTRTAVPSPDSGPGGGS